MSSSLKRQQPAFGLQEPKKLHISSPENFSSKGTQAPVCCNLLRPLLWATSHERGLYWMDQQHWMLLPRIQALNPAGNTCTTCRSHWARDPRPRSTWPYLPPPNPSGPGKASSVEERILCKAHAGLWKQAKQDFNLCLVSFDISSCAVRH